MRNKVKWFGFNTTNGIKLGYTFGFQHLSGGGDSFSNAYSLLFDGTDDRLVCSPASYEQCSIGFWVKTSSTSFGVLFGKENDNSFYISMSTGKFFVSNQMIGSTSGNSTFNDGNWHHLVVTFEGSSGGENEAKFYIDGSLDKTVTGENTYTNVTDKNIVIGGWSADSPLTLDGNMDEVSVWSNVLAVNEIVQIYNSGAPIDLSSDSGDYVSSANLINWWRMGDGDTHPTIEDNAGSNDGTMTNMTSGSLVEDVPE